MCPYSIEQKYGVPTLTVQSTSMMYPHLQYRTQVPGFGADLLGGLKLFLEESEEVKVEEVWGPTG